MENRQFTHNICERYCNQLIGLLFLMLAVTLNFRGYTQPVATVKEMSEIFDRQTNVAPTSDKEFSAGSLLPHPDKLVKEGTANGLRLDSVYEDKFYAHYLEKRKWLYHYNNDRLFSLEHLYFSDSYDEPLDLREIWYYNEAGKVSRYTKEEQLFSTLDTLFLDSAEDYIYEHENLVLQISTGWTRLRSGSKDVDGQSVEYYEIVYSYDSTCYFYNEKNLLIKRSNARWRETILYMYDLYDRLKMEITQWVNTIHCRRYDYEETDSTRTTIKKYVYFRDITDVSVFDTVTTWGNELYSYHVLDRLGRDSVQISYDTSSDYQFKTFYQYLQSGEISFVSIYYSDKREEQETWVEQARIEYSYDEYGNLLEYHRLFYDESVPGWKTEERKTYYYSSRQGTATGDMTTSSISLYPNPATDYITVKDLSGENVNYRVFNSMGQVVLSGKLENAVIPVSFLKSGVYILQLQDDHATNVHRFVKQ